jgi:hypothetical protein
VQALKLDMISIISKWLPNSVRVKRSDLSGMLSDSNESSEIEEFKVGSGGAATTSFHMQRKNSQVRQNRYNNSHGHFCDR